MRGRKLCSCKHFLVKWNYPPLPDSFSICLAPRLGSGHLRRGLRHLEKMPRYLFTHSANASERRKPDLMFVPSETAEWTTTGSGKGEKRGIIETECDFYRVEARIEYRRLTKIDEENFSKQNFLQKTVFEKEKDIKKEYLSIFLSQTRTAIQNLSKRIFYYYTTTLLYYFYTIIQNLPKRIFSKKFTTILPNSQIRIFITKFRRNVPNDPSSLFLSPSPSPQKNFNSRIVYRIQ